MYIVVVVAKQISGPITAANSNIYSSNMQAKLHNSSNTQQYAAKIFVACKCKKFPDAVSLTNHFPNSTCHSLGQYVDLEVCHTFMQQLLTKDNDILETCASAYYVSKENYAYCKTDI